MSAREVVEAYWAAMQANDWARAAALLAEPVRVEWPCSGERITSRESYAAVQERYPAAGRWSFDVHRLVVDGAVAVTEATVTDGEQSARVVAFSEVAGGLIVRQIEYWPAAYDPPAWRADLVEQGEQVP